MKISTIIKSLIIKLKILLADEYSLWKIYTKHYGVTIGKNCRITGKHISFGGEPFLVKIGDNVTITRGVRFLTHDGGVGLFRNEHPGINVFGKIIVGNNVFIGEDSLIMYDVTIGDNVIIGARSVVTKNVSSNNVVAGIPARVIKTIDEYKKKSMEKAIFIKSNNAEERKIEILNKLD